MRVCLLLLFAATVARAQEGYEYTLATFEAASQELLVPGSHARIDPALDKLVEIGDPRAVETIAAFIAETLAAEERLRTVSREEQKRGAVAYTRLEALDKQIAQLEVRMRSGATHLGPQVVRLKEERDTQERIFKEVQREVGQLGRRFPIVRKLRDRATDACVRLTAAAQGAAAEKAIVGLRRKLDIADAKQSLYLMRVLHGVATAATASHLIELLDHPKATDGATRTAITALAALKRRDGTEALLRLWERDERKGPAIRHALSLAAGRNLEDRAAAREWAATLPE